MWWWFCFVAAEVGTPSFRKGGAEVLPWRPRLLRDLKAQIGEKWLHTVGYNGTVQAKQRKSGLATSLVQALSKGLAHRHALAAALADRHAADELTATRQKLDRAYFAKPVPPSVESQYQEVLRGITDGSGIATAQAETTAETIDFKAQKIHEVTTEGNLIIETEHANRLNECQLLNDLIRLIDSNSQLYDCTGSPTSGSPSESSSFAEFVDDIKRVLQEYRTEIGDQEEEVKGESKEQLGLQTDTYTAIGKALKQARDGDKTALYNEDKQMAREIKSADGEADGEIQSLLKDLFGVIHEGGKSQQKVINSYASQNRAVDKVEDTAEQTALQLNQGIRAFDKIDQQVNKAEQKVEKHGVGMAAYIQSNVVARCGGLIDKKMAGMENAQLREVANAATQTTRQFTTVEKEGITSEKATSKLYDKAMGSMGKKFRHCLDNLDALISDVGEVCKDCTAQEAEAIANKIAQTVVAYIQHFIDMVAHSKSAEEANLKDIESNYETMMDQEASGLDTQIGAQFEALHKTTTATLDGPDQEGQQVLQFMQNSAAQNAAQVDHLSNDADSGHRGVQELDEKVQEASVAQRGAAASLEERAAQLQNEVNRINSQIAKVGDGKGPETFYKGLFADNPAEGANVLLQVKSKFMDEINDGNEKLRNLLGKAQQHSSQELTALERNANQALGSGEQLAVSTKGLQQSEMPLLEREAYKAKLAAEKEINKANHSAANFYRHFVNEALKSVTTVKKKTGSDVDSMVDQVSALAQSDDLSLRSELMNIKAQAVRVDDKDKINSNEIVTELAQLMRAGETLGGSIADTALYPEWLKDTYEHASVDIGPISVAQQKAQLLEQLTVMERATLAYMEKVKKANEQEEKDTLASYLRGFADKKDEGEKKLQDLVHVLAAQMARESSALDKERAGIEVKRSLTIEQVNEIEQFLKELQNNLHDESVSLETKVSSDLAESKRQVAGLGEVTDEELAKVMGTLRTELATMKRQLEGKSTEFDSSIMQQVDGSLYSMSNEAGRNDKVVQGLLQHLADKATEVEAADTSAEMTMKNGVKRWLEGSDANEQRAELVMRLNSAARSGASPTARSRSSQEVSADRMGASISTMGDQTEDISGRAADEADIAVSSVMSSAKTGEAEISMQLAKIEAQEKKAFEEQNQRDRRLAEAIGQDMDRMNDVQRQALRDYASSAAARDGIQTLLSNENDSLEKNAAYLAHYNQVTAEVMLKLMGEVALQIEHAMDGISKDQGYMDAAQIGTEMRVDDLLGSEAIKSLKKVQASDELAMKVETDDEFLAEWMKDFTTGSAEFRKHVEEGFSTSEEAMELHSKEMEKEEQENRDRDAKLEGKMVSGIKSMASEVSFDGVEGVDSGFADGMDAFEDMAKTTDGLDNLRIGNLEKILNGSSEQFAAQLGSAQEGMAKINSNGNGASESINNLEHVLGSMKGFYDKEAANQQKTLTLRLRGFSNDLLAAGVKVGGMEPAPPVTTDETARLLLEAQELAAKHTELEERHSEAEQSIGGLLKKLTAAVGKVNAQTLASQAGTTAPTPASQAGTTAPTPPPVVYEACAAGEVPPPDTVPMQGCNARCADRQCAAARKIEGAPADESTCDVSECMTYCGVCRFHGR